MLMGVETAVLVDGIMLVDGGGSWKWQWVVMGYGTVIVGGGAVVVGVITLVTGSEAAEVGIKTMEVENGEEAVKTVVLSDGVMIMGRVVEQWYCCWVTE